jgi:general secretion pathway protein G
MRRRYLSAIFLLIAVLAGGLLYSKYSSRRQRETALKQGLRIMREAIDSYTLDKQAAPQTLQDLVTARYLKRIPTDPFTRKEDWV